MKRDYKIDIDYFLILLISFDRKAIKFDVH